MLFSSLKKEIEGLVQYKNMKKLILSFLFLFVFVLESVSQIRYNINNEQQIAISYSNPKTYEVAEIEIIGEKYLDEIALKSLSSFLIL